MGYNLPAERQHARERVSRAYPGPRPTARTDVQPSGAPRPGRPREAIAEAQGPGLEIARRPWHRTAFEAPVPSSGCPERVSRGRKGSMMGSRTVANTVSSDRSFTSNRPKCGICASLRSCKYTAYGAPLVSDGGSCRAVVRSSEADGPSPFPGPLRLLDRIGHVDVTSTCSLRSGSRGVRGNQITRTSGSSKRVGPRSERSVEAREHSSRTVTRREHRVATDGDSSRATERRASVRP
ncbi:m108 protein [Murid betaherpesvirus 1]|nr:m108 protein [Murid betaherpesvirus 1]